MNKRDRCEGTLQRHAREKEKASLRTTETCFEKHIKGIKLSDYRVFAPPRKIRAKIDE
jgi:hypothetical protein